jgi:hypothetical protein
VRASGLPGLLASDLIDASVLGGTLYERRENSTDNARCAPITRDSVLPGMRCDKRHTVTPLAPELP